MMPLQPTDSTTAMPRSQKRFFAPMICALMFLATFRAPEAFGAEMDSARAKDVAQSAIDDAKDAVSAAPAGAGAGSGSGAGDAQGEKLSAEFLLEQETLGAWPYRPLRNMKEGASLLIDKQNQWALGGGLVAVVGATALDNKAKDYFFQKRRIGDLQNLGNHYLGTGVPGTLLGAGFWLFGEVTGRWYESHAGQAQLEALLVTGLITAVIKGSVNRERPDHSDFLSFPSGHTSTVFASAMVLQEFYGWKAGVPAFMLGALTAASRMSEGRHWLSDTAGGALVGIIVGHAFSRAHLNRFDSVVKDSKRQTTKVSVYPVFEDGGGKLIFKATF